MSSKKTLEADVDFKAFIATIPSAEKIRERIFRNHDENKVLKKLLRLAVEKENQQPEPPNETA